VKGAELTMLKLIESSYKVARLSEAGYAYETKLRELEHQFESKAAELREAYLAAVLKIHERRNGRRRPNMVPNFSAALATALSPS
jgi:hypothetical protein